MSYAFQREHTNFPAEPRTTQLADRFPLNLPHYSPYERNSSGLALVTMLERPEGVTIAEIVAATGWQPHTVRGALAGALKKRLGPMIVSEKVEALGRLYRLG